MIGQSHLGEAYIGGSLFLIDDEDRDQRLRIHGRFELGRATVHGRIMIRNADLAAPPAGTGRLSYNSPDPMRTAAILAPGLTLTGDLSCHGDTHIHGGIDLSGAHLAGSALIEGAALDSPDDTALDLSQATLGAWLSLRGTTVPRVREPRQHEDRRTACD